MLHTLGTIDVVVCNIWSARFCIATLDTRIEAGIGHAPDQPLARCDILRRQRRPMNSGLVGAEAAQLVEIAEDALGVY